MTFSSAALPYVRFEMPVFAGWEPSERQEFPNGVRFLLPHSGDTFAEVAPQIRVTRRTRDGSALGDLPVPDPGALPTNPNGVRYALAHSAFRSSPRLEPSFTTDAPSDLLCFYREGLIIDVQVWADETFPYAPFAEEVIRTFTFDAARIPWTGTNQRAHLEIRRRETVGHELVDEDRETRLFERGSVLGLPGAASRGGARLFEISAIGLGAIVLAPLNEQSLHGLREDAAMGNTLGTEATWSRTLAVGQALALVDALAPARRVEWNIRVLRMEPYPPLAPSSIDALRNIAETVCTHASLDPGLYRFQMQETSEGYVVTGVDANTDPGRPVVGRGSLAAVPSIEIYVDKPTLRVQRWHFQR